MVGLRFYDYVLTREDLNGVFVRFRCAASLLYDAKNYLKHGSNLNS
jgi:hypothetical protein